MSVIKVNTIQNANGTTALTIAANGQLSRVNTAIISDGTYSTSANNVIQGSAKAWVNFNGTLSGTITPRASFNVNSVTKNSTGIYTINFTTAMPDANYAAVIGANINSSNNDMRRDSRIVTWSTSNVIVVTGDSSGNSDTKEDYEFVTVVVFR